MNLDKQLSGTAKRTRSDPNDHPEQIALMDCSTMTAIIL